MSESLNRKKLVAEKGLILDRKSREDLVRIHHEQGSL